MTRTRILVAGAIVALAAVPGAAFAADSPGRVAALKARGDAEIQRRLVTLAADATRVTDAQQKSKVDLSSLSSLISADQSGLTALKTKIDTQDTTVAQLVPDVQSIVTAYRVYVLVDPKIHLTIAADREAMIAQLLTTVDQTLTAKVNALPPTQPGVADAKAALADLGPKVADALSKAGQVPGNVASLSPSGYPANASVLKSNLTTVQQVRTELGQARADVERIRSDIKP